jgi:DNA-binding response OmpR family regulator
MKALVVSRDPEMIGTFSALFHERNVETRECFLGSVAIDQLSSNKFEFVVLDFDQVPGCADIVRRLPRPDKYVVIAVNTDRRDEEVASAGQAFVIDRPLVPSQIRDLLTGVHGRMLHERQAYFRLPIELSVSIHRRTGE